MYNQRKMKSRNRNKKCCSSTRKVKPNKGSEGEKENKETTGTNENYAEEERAKEKPSNKMNRVNPIPALWKVLGCWVYDHKDVDVSSIPGP